MLGSGDKRNSRVTHSREMLNCLSNSAYIVDADVGNAGYVRPYIYEYERDLTIAEVFDQRFFHAKGQDGHAVHPAFDHPAHRGFHAFGIVHGGGQQDLVVIFNGQIFEGLNYFRKERIRNLRDNEAEDAGAAQYQRARLSVGVIAQFVDDAPHSFGELRIDRGNTVNGSGDRGRGNFRPPGNLTYIHSLGGRGLLLRNILSRCPGVS